MRVRSSGAGRAGESKHHSSRKARIGTVATQQDPAIEGWVQAGGAVMGTSLAWEIHCAPYGGVSPSGSQSGLLCSSVSNRSKSRIAR